MRLTRTLLSDVILVEPQIYSDNRGSFHESYHFERYVQDGIPARFVQDNISHSRRGVLRGLHYQLGNPQAKLVIAVQGEIFDVALDIRSGSPSFGKWVGTVLSSENYCQAFIPEGFAHGFCVLSETATVLYKCTDYYAPAQERGIRWNDPELGIEWPVTDPILSPKDSTYPTLKDLPADQLPVFRSRL